MLCDKSSETLKPHHPSFYKVIRCANSKVSLSEVYDDNLAAMFIWKHSSWWSTAGTLGFPQPAPRGLGKPEAAVEGM